MDIKQCCCYEGQIIATKIFDPHTADEIFSDWICVLHCGITGYQFITIIVLGLWFGWESGTECCADVDQRYDRQQPSTLKADTESQLPSYSILDILQGSSITHSWRQYNWSCLLSATWINTDESCETRGVCNSLITSADLSAGEVETVMYTHTNVSRFISATYSLHTYTVPYPHHSYISHQTRGERYKIISQTSYYIRLLFFAPLACLMSQRRSSPLIVLITKSFTGHCCRLNNHPNVSQLSLT